MTDPKKSGALVFLVEDAEAVHSTPAFVAIQ